MKRSYDVIVAGAGPAGSTLAYELARRGVSVLAIDKAEFPRYKCCAAGLTVKAAKLLGGEPTGKPEDTISNLELSFAGADRYCLDYPEPIMYTTTRYVLDHILVQRAEKAGAIILPGVNVLGVNVGDKGVEVDTGAGSFQAQFVAAADGNHSAVAKSLALEIRDRVVAIETEIEVGAEDQARWKSRVLLDLGWISRGYGWLFPKSDHLSIGIACFQSKARNLKGAYWRFLDSLNLGHYAVRKWSAGFIPVCGGRPVFSRGRAVLLGDAAGLADPLTGEGIYQAILSAQLAAPAMESALLYGPDRLHGYQSSVEERLMPEIRAARFFSRLLALVPRRLFNFIGTDKRTWNAGCRLLRGETSYQAIRKRIESLGGIFTLLARR